MSDDTSENLEAVFDRHFDDVYGYIAYRLAPDREAAQDVTQEVFLAALNGWASYRGDASMLSWLRGIARHKVADHLRNSNWNDREVSLNDLSELAAAKDTGPLQRAVMLAQVMRTLPPKYVELIEEKYIDGLSIRQMAQKHARTQKAMESALSRAREMLRNSFLRREARQEHRNEDSQS